MPRIDSLRTSTLGLLLIGGMGLVAFGWRFALGEYAFGEVVRASKAGPIKVAASDWPWWRGPTSDGVAAQGENPPLVWSDKKNVLWRCPVPGRGHGSPTVIGDQILLATGEPEGEVQSVLCYDRVSGKQLWRTVVHSGGFDSKGNKKSSQASSSVATDGERLFINFLSGGAVYATALDRSGKKLWQTKISDFVNHQGFGASPILYQSLVLISADNKGGGAIAALDRASGEVVWRQERKNVPNYASPIVVHAASRDQIVMIGCDVVAGFDPLTGEKLWEAEGSTTECVTSTVTDGQRIFTSGGYPKNHVSAVNADGSGKVVWENNSRVYVPSMLVRESHLYAVLDAGVAMCWKSDTGEEIWKGRLSGTFSSSPIRVGENILATNEEGRTFIFRASPGGFELVGENQLGDESFATPVACGQRLYFRVAFSENDQRQEYLYCIGQK